MNLRALAAATTALVLAVAWACWPVAATRTVHTAAPPPASGPPGRVRIAPLTPLDANRISADERAAIEALGASGAGVPAHSHAHGNAKQVEQPLVGEAATTFDAQWQAAVDAVPNFDTTAKAAALGYAQASLDVAGVGTHWVKWSQIAQPFDPARPAMLLFDQTQDPAVLVGYSYFVQGSVAPEGFAGPNDHWHQHSGYCIVNGWVDREEAAGPPDCAGTYIAGGDLWMLHAWVVPAYPDRFGRFADANPLLCPSAAGTPEFMRCPWDAPGAASE